MRFCFHSVKFSCNPGGAPRHSRPWPSTLQSSRSLCRRFHPLPHVLDSLISPGLPRRDAAADPGLPLKCPTSRIPGSGAPSRFLRSHASSNGVAGSASGCWDSPSETAPVVLPTSTPATDDRCSSCGLSEDAAGAVLALTGGCSSSSSCSPASTSLRMRRRPKMSRNPAAVLRL